MRFGLPKLWLAVVLLAALWGLSQVRESEPLRPLGTQPGPVRITQFYANTATVAPGQKALLCYGVENARSVRISPMVAGAYPSPGRCLEIVPEHTTHYTLMAEGFDGKVDMRSFTLPVEQPPVLPRNLRYARYEP